MDSVVFHFDLQLCATQRRLVHILKQAGSIFAPCVFAQTSARKTSGDLTDEIWRTIAGFLTLPEQLCLRQTCRRLCNVVAYEESFPDQLSRYRISHNPVILSWLCAGFDPPGGMDSVVIASVDVSFPRGTLTLHVAAEIRDTLITVVQRLRRSQPACFHKTPMAVTCSFDTAYEQTVYRWGRHAQFLGVANAP